jgi:hypothetical protein
MLPPRGRNRGRSPPLARDQNAAGLLPPFATLVSSPEELLRRNAGGMKHNTSFLDGELFISRHLMRPPVGERTQLADSDEPLTAHSRRQDKAHSHGRVRWKEPAAGGDPEAEGVPLSSLDPSERTKASLAGSTPLCVHQCERPPGGADAAPSVPPRITAPPLDPSSFVSLRSLSLYPFLAVSISGFRSLSATDDYFPSFSVQFLFSNVQMIRQFAPLRVQTPSEAIGNRHGIGCDVVRSGEIVATRISSTLLKAAVNMLRSWLKSLRSVCVLRAGR